MEKRFPEGASPEVVLHRLSIWSERSNGKEQERSLPARQSGPNVPAFKERIKAECSMLYGQMAIEMEDNRVAPEAPPFCSLLGVVCCANKGGAWGHFGHTALNIRL